MPSNTSPEISSTGSSELGRDPAELITLKGSSDVRQRIDLLLLLQKKADDKVVHADTFRQTNMNYALAIFGAVIALDAKLGIHASQKIIWGTVAMLMLMFCIWDRRWHRTKHGWEYSSRIYYHLLQTIVNAPSADVAYKLYYPQGESGAEWLSFQPIVFYILVAASVVSLAVFGW